MICYLAAGFWAGLRARASQSPLCPVESALADEFRVLGEIGRSCLCVSLLESALTRGRLGNSFRICTYEKARGRAGALGQLVLQLA